MSDGLTTKTLRGLFWSFFERGAYQLVQLTVSIVLARILLPEEFGLVAILVVFIAIGNSLVDSGFGSALIQDQTTSHLDECSVFYFNIALSVLVAAILTLSAPAIAHIYGYPILVPLCRVLSLNIVLGALGAIHLTLLTKNVDFGTQSKISLIAAAISGLIGISMAYRGFGVWSLATQSVASAFFRTTLAWLFHDWRPSLQFSSQSLFRMFPFGSRLLISGLLNTVFNNIYSLVIGKVFSARDLGFYSRADQLQQIPVLNLTAAVGRVLFPVFSSVQQDKERLKRGVRITITSLALINFPLMVGLAIVAKPLIVVLLTDKWLPSVLYLQMLCAIGLLYPLHAINLSALKAQGRSDLFLKLEVIKRILVITSIAITYRWGIIAMISGAIVVSLFGYYLNAYYSGKFFDYPITEQILDLFPALLVSFVMGTSVYLVRYLSISSPLVLLTCQSTVGVVVYFGLCRIFRIAAFMNAWGLLKTRLNALSRE